MYHFQRPCDYNNNNNQVIIIIINYLKRNKRILNNSYMNFNIIIFDD